MIANNLREATKKPMTFALGMAARDGLLICTDSLESDGLTKRTVDKIQFAFAGTVGGNGWSVAMAGAGPGGLLDKFFSEVRVALPQRTGCKRQQVETLVEEKLADFRSKFPDEHFRIILGACEHLGAERFLYRSDDTYLSPVKDHAHVGMGHSLWRFLTEMIYEKGNSVADNVRLAIFVMKQAIKYVDGVDDPIQVATFTFGDEFWKAKHPGEIREIEADFEDVELALAMQAFWRQHNPPTLREQARTFGGVRTPGDELTLLEGVRLEELYTVAGRKRAARTFRRNTDKLQQRASLQARRYRQAQSGGSRSSSGKTRT